MTLYLSVTVRKTGAYSENTSASLSSPKWLASRIAPPNCWCPGAATGKVIDLKFSGNVSSLVLRKGAQTIVKRAARTLNNFSLGCQKIVDTLRAFFGGSRPQAHPFPPPRIRYWFIHKQLKNGDHGGSGILYGSPHVWPVIATCQLYRDSIAPMASSVCMAVRATETWPG